MEKGMPSGRRKNKIQIYKKIDDENKTNLQQHKYLESGSRKPNKIPRDFFQLRKRKSEDETNRNVCQKDSI